MNNIINKESIDNLIKKYFPFGKTPRKEQLETIYKIIEAYINNKDHFIGQLPTGVGKSYIAIIIPKILKEINSHLKRSVILTKTKALQDQYTNEFPELVDIKGKTNYICSFGTSYTTDECLKLVKSKKCNRENCPYLKQRTFWENTEEDRITNMSFYVSYKKANSDIVIIDECHTLSDELVNFGTLTIDEKEINFFKEKSLDNAYLNFETIIISLEDFISKINKIVLSSKELANMSKNLLNVLKDRFEELEELKDENSFFNKLYNYVENLINKVEIFHNSSGEFILNLTKINEDAFNEPYKIISIKPIFANQIANYIFNKGSFFIHLSATIGDIEVYAKENGIKNYSSYECNSPFPIKNRKIVYKPVIDFNYNNFDNAIKQISKIVDKIIEKHSNENGIIHTSSYNIAWEIKNNSKYSNKIVVAKDSETINKYKGKKILIGPTLYEGHDFKDDFARWQILTKIPYASLGDTYVKIKTQLYPKWYQQDAANKIIQSYGRAVRHKNDKAIFYIFDKNFEKFKNSSFLPLYVKDAIIEIK